PLCPLLTRCPRDDGSRCPPAWLDRACTTPSEPLQAFRLGTCRSVFGVAYCLTGRTVVCAEDWLPNFSTTGTSPVAMPSGTCTLIWKTPANVIPANNTFVGRVPNRTWTCDKSVTGNAPEITCPAGYAGVVCPRPVPYSVM